MRRYKLLFILIFLFLFLAGCAGGEYLAEKLYWKATKKYNHLLKNLDEAKAVDFQEVIMAYREVIGRFPNWRNTPNAYFNVSHLYILQKQYSQARAELEKVKENFSKMPDVAANAEFTIGLIYEEEDRWDEAFKRFKSIEDKYPQTYSALQVPLQIARHYKKISDVEKENEAYQQALSKYKTMIEQKPDTLGALAVLDFIITAYVEQDKKDEALVYLDALIEKYPKSAIKAKALLSKGILYYQLGKTDESIRSLEKIVSDFPDSNLAKMAEAQIKKIKEGKKIEPED
jgi:tetratricopeptide (TPR) repeat protein